MGENAKLVVLSILLWSIVVVGLSMDFAGCKREGYSDGQCLARLK